MLFAVGRKDFVLWPLTIISIFVREWGGIANLMGVSEDHIHVKLASSLGPFLQVLPFLSTPPRKSMLCSSVKILPWYLKWSKCAVQGWDPRRWASDYPQVRNSVLNWLEFTLKRQSIPKPGLNALCFNLMVTSSLLLPVTLGLRLFLSPLPFSFFGLDSDLHFQLHFSFMSNRMQRGTTTARKWKISSCPSFASHAKVVVPGPGHHSDA